MARKKKKKGMRSTATFKAFIIVILALFIIWIAVKLNNGGFQILKIDGTEQFTQISTEATTVNIVENTSTSNEGAQVSELEVNSTETLAEDARLAEGGDEATVSTADIVEVTTAPASREESADGLSNRSVSWSFKRNSTHSPVEGYNEGVDLASFDAHYIGNTDEKLVYLTFDEGYENGYTSQILDTLARNEVKAAFFVTKAYVDGTPELVKRMKEEGHIVANHSATHPDMTTKSDEEFFWEIDSTRHAMEDASGYKMDMFFRPPQGKFSERTLQMTKDLGYTTMLWSMAYKDWLVDAQPGRDVAYQHVTENIHPGALILLHAVSQSNAEALDDIIKEVKSQGYSFGTIDDFKK